MAGADARPRIATASCASARVAAATTASPAVECRPTRPVRADPPPLTILIATTGGTTTINPSERHRAILAQLARPGVRRWCAAQRGEWASAPSPASSLLIASLVASSAGRYTTILVPGIACTARLVVVSVSVAYAGWRKILR